MSLNRRQFFGAVSAAAGALFGGKKLLPLFGKKLLPNSGVAIMRQNRALYGYSSVRASMDYQRAYNHALSARMEILALRPQYYYVAGPPIKLYPEPKPGDRFLIEYVGPVDPPC